MKGVGTLGIPQKRWRTAVAAGAATVAAGAATSHCLLKVAHSGHHSKPLPLIPQPVSDAVAGAVGEIAQTCVLYPLETIKVRCQADGISAMEVLRSMLARYGMSLKLLTSLYSGFSSSACLSMAVGAVHWLSFCAAKRAAMEHLPKLSSSTAAAASLCETSGTTEASHGHGHLHVSSGHHIHTDHHEGATGGPLQAEGTGDLASKTGANLFAAVMGAFCTAIIESPVELFRHQAQAGIISGNLVQEMSASIRRGGPFALWTGFLPFLLEAFPYDMSELGSYSQLRDTWDELSQPGRRLHNFSKALPEHAWDLMIGGAAGGAAVLVSMPFDTIKTYLQTHETAAGLSLGGQVSLFFRTGANMVKRRGPSALFVGMVPRLIQQVPSSTICWYAVEQAQKAMAPYIKGGAQSSHA